MRCRACDTLLSDYDMVRKDKRTGEYLDLCPACYTESLQALYDAIEDNSTTYVDTFLMELLDKGGI